MLGTCSVFNSTFFNMPKQLHVKGLAQLLEELKNLEAQEDVFILFTGSKDDTGKSWCPDCNDGRCQTCR